MTFNCAKRDYNFELKHLFCYSAYSKQIYIVYKLLCEIYATEKYISRRKVDLGCFLKHETPS